MKAAFLFLMSATLLVFSCRKESFITSPEARVRITVDTLKFDTVFTQVGSVTQSFKIVNENDQKLRLTSVSLEGGASSAFKLNVDGTSATEVNNIEIDANDSVYVFVRVNVDPSAGNLPFILRDSIQVSYNGVDQIVQLEAWGQNANFIRDEDINSNTTWTNALPYVILGHLRVNEGVTLTIQKGTRIYVHANAPLIIDGTLQVFGEKDTIDRVIFTGDRLDEPYRDFPASWPGIYFGDNSRNNVMRYAIIKNAYQAIGITNPSVNANPKLVLQECVIDNSFDAGIIAINSSITARNCQISNCGRNIVIARGGEYDFTHCTIASISNNFIQHREPVILLSNTDGVLSAPLNATFTNCIIWGENGIVDNEVATVKDASNPFNVNFDHVLWKVQSTPNGVTTSGPAPINNENPLFDSIDVSKHYYNFRLKEGSPAIDQGVITAIITDLDGNPRVVNLPDLGSFEKQP